MNVDWLPKYLSEVSAGCLQRSWPHGITRATMEWLIYRNPQGAFFWKPEEGSLLTRILANNVSPIRQELWCWEHTWPFPRIFLKYREDGKPSDCTSRLMQIKALCLPFKWSQKISVQFANILIKICDVGLVKSGHVKLVISKNNNDCYFCSVFGD